MIKRLGVCRVGQDGEGVQGNNSVAYADNEHLYTANLSLRF